MKQFLFCIFLIVGSVSFGQINQTDAQGRKQGKWQKIYPGTRVYQYKGQFKDDKPIGTFYYYHKNNRPKAIIKHESKLNRSVATFYHETGGVISHGIYRNQKKDSVWTGFDNTGILRFKETYKNGKLNGKRQEFFPPEQGTKKQVTLTIKHYKNDLLDGEFREYFENGFLREKGYYVQNNKNGVWETYHSTGKKMMQVRYKKGIKHGWSFAYNETGKEIARNYYYKGERYTGDRLKKLLAQMKEKGIHPND